MDQPVNGLGILQTLLRAHTTQSLVAFDSLKTVNMAVKGKRIVLLFDLVVLSGRIESISAFLKKSMIKKKKECSVTALH